jgi:flavin reductase (DIM6/NTAB) family NADH-FMN oxidoreductase RutF/DNA-binding IclR family transcriptional regulator
MDTPPAPPDPMALRRILGHYPTGVTVVTTIAADGSPAGMTVGSFTSASLDPPLVAFFAARSAGTFQAIRTAGHFCINVLAADQEPLCRAFAIRGSTRFADVGWSPASSGAPILENVIAWIDCDLEKVHDAGDHCIALGRVRELDVTNPSLPLLFFQGGYGQFTPRSLVAGAEADLVAQLRVADLARREMELVAADLDMLCLARAVVGNSIVALASAGTPKTDRVPPLGVRVPFVPPIGALFVAWSEPPVVEAWLDRSPVPLDAEARLRYERTLELVRRRGSLTLADSRFQDLDWSLSRIATEGHTDELDHQLRQVINERLHDVEAEEPTPDRPYDVRSIGSPVFGPTGTVVLVLSLFELPPNLTTTEIDRPRRRLMAAADAVTARIGGRRPRELGLPS